jgi:CheY-like chemotaxis protein
MPLIPVLPSSGPASIQANGRPAFIHASSREHHDGARSAVVRLRVLIVDDEPEFRESFRWVLEQLYGCSVDEAEHARELDQQISSGATFDLIFIDVQMPEKDGIQIYEELHAAGNTTPVVLMSALAQNRSRVERLGIPFFDKALDGPTLDGIIGEHGGSRVQ